MENKAITITFKASEEQIAKMKSFYEDTIEEGKNEYMSFFVKGEGFSLSLYKSGKAVFQGPDAEKEASLFSSSYSKSESSSNNASPGYIQNRYPQIGSDEVGTGDFFGPIIVCAAYVKEKDLPRLTELGVTDSKKMDDDTIRSIGPILIKEFDYSLMALNNEKYNSIHDDYNMNAIKAKLHNGVLRNLRKRHPSSTVYIDQFAEKNIYFNYLKDEEEVVRDISFSTKGEIHFPSVALASVIARYSFLLKMDDLSSRLRRQIPKGAGKDVEEFLQDLMENRSDIDLSKIAKLNFKTYEKVSK